MSRSSLSRRSLLQGLGLSAGLVPMLTPARSGAAEGGRPKRLIVIAVPNGYTSDCLPVGTGAAWTAKDVEFSPLKPLTAPGLKERLLIIDGVTVQNGIDTARQVKMSPTANIGGHAILPMLLTGAKAVPGPSIPDGWRLSSAHASVDQYVVQNSDARSRPIPSLVLRPVRLSAGGYGNQPLSYSGRTLDGTSHNAPSMRDDPGALFDLVFGANLDTATLERLRAERRSVLDFTSNQLRTLQSRLGRDDRQRVEKHLTGVQQVEKLIASAGTSATCSKPTRPDAANWSTDAFNRKMDLVMRAHMDITVRAMACDVTRVASYNWCSSNNNTIVFNWLASKIPSLTDTFTGRETGGSGNNFKNHHTVAHNDGALRREKNCIDQFFLESYAYLIQQLIDTPDFDGKPMIDNTLVLFANMQRTGGGHQVDRMLWFLAGNAEGYFKSGRHVQTGGVPTNRILAALVNAMGCPRVEHFGDPEYGGELPALRI